MITTDCRCFPSTSRSTQNKFQTKCSEMWLKIPNGAYEIFNRNFTSKHRTLAGRCKSDDKIHIAINVGQLTGLAGNLPWNYQIIARMLSARQRSRWKPCACRAMTWRMAIGQLNNINQRMKWTSKGAWQLRWATTMCHQRRIESISDNWCRHQFVTRAPPVHSTSRWEWERQRAASERQIIGFPGEKCEL